MKTYSVSFAGGITLRFAEKPPAAVRDMLKRNGFRWQPPAGAWYCRSCADGFLPALDRVIAPGPNGLGPAHGTCWTCKDAPGWLRPSGPFAPVLCDECHEADKAQRGAQTSASRSADDPMGVDRLYEDSCRTVCGL
jgi:hypothetical protein